jgi:hypothetical protein
MQRRYVEVMVGLAGRRYAMPRRSSTAPAASWCVTNSERVSRAMCEAEGKAQQNPQ